MGGLPLKEEDSHEIIHYKKYGELKSIIGNIKPNIIIHGVSNSGKTYLIEYILKRLYGEYRPLTEDKITFRWNGNYYIFDFSNHLRNIIMKKIESIVKNYDHFNNTVKYIIIDNYNNIPDIIQKNIKVFIEKYSKSSRFILITNKPFSIDPSTRSSCFSIKINEPNKYDKFIYFKYLLKKYKVKYNSFLLFKHCEKYSIDHIAKLYYDDEVIYCNVYEKTIHNIYEIMNTEFNITEIKKISMNIKELNLNVVKLFSTFFKNNPYSQSKNILLIKEIAHYNYIIKKAYRDIISIEALLIKIYHILNYG
tara:strand:+ start:613 stop:1533 length:921 start_codon:yes stop_codon:yes gene_type:complete